MPTYDYKCNTCKDFFTTVHSMKEKATNCDLCGSLEIEKTISSFAAKTENSLEHLSRHLEVQAKKDNARFHKDDKFAANITGADDPNHAAKMQKALQDIQKKNEEARQKIKRVNP